MGRRTFTVLITGLIYCVPIVIALGVTAFVNWDADFSAWGQGGRLIAVTLAVLLVMFQAAILEIDGARRKFLRNLLDEMDTDA